MLEFIMIVVFIMVFVFSCYLGGNFIAFWEEAGLQNLLGDWIPTIVSMLILIVINMGFWIGLCWLLYKNGENKKAETRKRYTYCNAKKCPHCYHTAAEVKYVPEFPKEINIVKICSICGFRY